MPLIFQLYTVRLSFCGRDCGSSAWSSATFRFFLDLGGDIALRWIGSLADIAMLSRNFYPRDGAEQGTKLQSHIPTAVREMMLCQLFDLRPNSKDGS